MRTLYVLPLGPIDTGEGARVLFIGMLDHAPFGPAKSLTAEAAMAELRAAAPPGVALECAPELGRVGVVHGFRPVPPSRDVLNFRAVLATVIAHVDVAPQAFGELVPLLAGAAAFWKARAWERAPMDVAAGVAATGDVEGTWELALLGNSGDEYGVALYPEPGSVARLKRLVEQGRVDQVASVPSLCATLDAEPAFAVEAVEAAFGLPRCAMLFGTLAGRPRALTRDEVLVLAGTFRALAAWENLGAPSAHTVPGTRLTVTVSAARA